MPARPQAAEKFHALHRDFLILPNAWDAGSARVVQEAGAQAIATSSAAVAWAHGYADGHGLPVSILVTSKKVKCDGGGGALGHPVVYYDMGEDDFVECLYCDRRFVLGDHADSH